MKLEILAEKLVGARRLLPGYTVDTESMPELLTEQDAQNWIENGFAREIKDKKTGKNADVQL